MLKKWGVVARGGRPGDLTGIMGAHSKTEDDGPPAPGTRLCVMCAHYRRRPKYELFSAGHLQAPGVLKAKTEWDQQLKQRAEQEAQRLAASLPFDYEPHHYAWCAKLTPVDECSKANAGDTAAKAKLMQKGNAAMDPVTGKITALYTVCAQVNPTGQCRLYEPKRNELDTARTARR